MDWGNTSMAKAAKAVKGIATNIMAIATDENGFNERLYRKEVSRLAALANKRVQRLEKNKLDDSPSYKKLVENGHVKFGVRGKTFNEVQQELSKIKSFISSKTSTIRGINTTLKEMATNTGIKYKNMAELKSKSSKFFELSSKVEQYLRTVEDMGSAIGYQKIWEVINEYTQENRIELDNTKTDVESLTELVSQALINIEEPPLDFEFNDDFITL